MSELGRMLEKAAGVEGRELSPESGRHSWKNTGSGS